MAELCYRDGRITKMVCVKFVKQILKLILFIGVLILGFYVFNFGMTAPNSSAAEVYFASGLAIWAFGGAFLAKYL